MTPELFLVIAALKATLIIAIAYAFVIAMRRASAAMRHAILVAAMIAAMLLPVLMVLIPPRPVRVPVQRHFTDDAILLLLQRSDGERETAAPARVALARSAKPLLVMWAVGLIASLVRIAFDLFAASRIRRGARRRDEVFESDDVSSPAVVGVLRPIIIVPRGMHDADVLRAVLAHERAHIDRRDCLVQLLVRITCAMYWFNPLAWRAARRIALERERACDDRVLAAGSAPLFYSELLVGLAERQSPMLIGAAQAMADRAQLESRLRSLLDATAVRGALRRRMAIAIVVGTALVTSPIAAFSVRDTPTAHDLADPYVNPQSERVPGTRTVASPPLQNALVARLTALASRDAESPSDLVPDRARWALSLIRRDDDPVERFIDALADPDWRVRGYAAWVLAFSNDARAVEPLFALLQHPVWRLRAMGAHALRALADPRAAEAMKPMLRDEAWQVRFEAVQYFSAIGDRALIEPLRHDPHIAVRSAVEH